MLTRTHQKGFGEGLIIYGVVFAGLALLGWLAYSAVSEHFREQGRAEIRAELAPLSEQCAKTKGTPKSCAEAWQAAVDANRTLSADVEKMRIAVAAQDLAIAEAEDAARQAKAQSSKILAELARRSAATQSQIARLTALAATPAASREVACNEADSILRDLAARRLRYVGGSASDGGGSDGNGTGSRSDSLRISK